MPWVLKRSILTDLVEGRCVGHTAPSVQLLRLRCQGPDPAVQLSLLHACGTGPAVLRVAPKPSMALSGMSEQAYTPQAGHPSGHMPMHRHLCAGA